MRGACHRWRILSKDSDINVAFHVDRLADGSNVKRDSCFYIHVVMVVSIMVSQPVFRGTQVYREQPPSVPREAIRKKLTQFILSLLEYM